MSKSSKYIIFSENYIDKNQNRLEKNTKYRIRSQDAKYYYVGKCKIDKVKSKDLYQIGDFSE